MGQTPAHLRNRPGDAARLKIKEALELLLQAQEAEKKELKEAVDLHSRVKDDIDFMTKQLDLRGTRIKVLEEMFK